MERTRKSPRPVISRWHVKAVIVILALFVAYLTLKSFMTGYREGVEMRKALGK